MGQKIHPTGFRVAVTEPWPDGDHRCAIQQRSQIIGGFDSMAHQFGPVRRHLLAVARVRRDADQSRAGSQCRLATQSHRARHARPTADDQHMSPIRAHVEKPMRSGSSFSITPSITGSAWVTAESTLIIENDDPLRMGFST